MPKTTVTLKDAIDNATDPIPMEVEIWAAGADHETAKFVARLLRDRGYYLVNPDNLEWDDIKRYQDVLREGQGIYEDGGGFFIRAIMSLFGKSYDPVKTYQDAARELLSGAEKD